MKKILKKIPWRFIPVILIFCFLPLIVRLVHFELDPIYYDCYINSDHKDWFFYYKSVIFIGLTVWILLCMVVLRKQIQPYRDRWFNIYYGSGAVFILFTLLSTLLSPYKDFAIVGAPSRFEGVGVMVCYILVMFYACVVFERAPSFKYIFYSFAFIVLIQFITGITQFVGYDIASWSPFRELVSPGEFSFYYPEVTGSVPFFLHTQPKDWTGTIGNRNYAGSLIALSTPLFMLLAFFVKEHKQRLFFGFMTLVSLYIMLLSGSRAGMFGVFCSVVVGVGIMFKYLPTAFEHFKLHKPYRQISFWGYSIFIVTSLMFVSFVSGTQQDISNMFSDITIADEDPTQIDDSKLKAFEYDTNQLHVLTAADALTLTFENENVTFTDQNAEPVLYTLADETIYSIQDPRFASYSFNIQHMGTGCVLTLLLGEEPAKATPLCSFIVNSTGDVSLRNPYNFEAIMVEMPPTIGFEGYERLGSGRGYIWSRSLPLLKDTLLLGYGPDAYLFEFPQQDFWGKLEGLGNPFVGVDKPHNAYLQLWINQGFIALLAFLVFNAAYLIHCLKLYAFKKIYTLYEGIGMGLMLAVIGYLGSCFFNDTTISVTPLYFVLLGCGMAYNRIYDHKAYKLSRD